MIDFKLLSRSLEGYIANPDKYVFPFVIKEKGNKERTIITYNKYGEYGASLKSVHEDITEAFSTHFAQRNSNSFAYHKNIRCRDALTSHLKSNYFIKLDIHHFFESITEELFFKIYGEYFNDDWKKAIKGLFYKGSLSIGFVSSPLISDFFMKKFDQDIDNYLKDHAELHYSRYSDDILLSSELDDDTSLNKLFDFVKEQLSVYKLEINEKKTRKVHLDFKSHNSISYLGLNLSKEDEVNNKVTISKRYINFLLFLIAKHRGYKDHCYPLENEIKSRISYLAYNSQISYARFQKKHNNIYGEPFRFVPKIVEARSVAQESSNIQNFDEYSSTFTINIHKQVVLENGFVVKDAIELERYLGDKEVDEISIPPFVDSIGTDAFAGAKIKKVVLNEKLKVICKRAFSRSTVEEINLPNSLRYIGPSAFEGSNIKKVKIPQYIREIDNGVFSNSKLEEVELVEGLEGIGENAFRNTLLKEVNFPDSLTEIKARAFEDCSYLVNTNIASSNVFSIGESAFDGCVRLKEVTFPESLLIIKARAFASCSFLEKVYIPSSVTDISCTAFKYCPHLKSIEISENNRNYLSRKDNSSIVTNNRKLIFTLKDTIDEDILSLDAYPFGNELLMDIVVPEGVTSIGNNAFINCKMIKSISLPHSLTSIGSGAFSGCTSLTSITLPENIHEIKQSTFESCINLKEVNCLGKIYKIGKSAFRNDTKLIFKLGEEIESIGQFAFAKCTSIKDLYIGEKVKSIGKDAFLGLPKELNSITVNPYNFHYSSENSNILILNKYGRVILGCKNSVIPEGITSIYKYAFAYCTELKTIKFPKTLKDIKEGSFTGCSNLSEVDFNIVRHIDKKAFKDCSSLKNIDLPNSLTDLGDEAFAGTGLISFAFPDSLTQLGNDVIKDCDNLEELYIPRNFRFDIESTFRHMRFANLNRIVVDENNHNYMSPNDCNAIISRGTKKLVLGSGSTVIPNEVKSIIPHAFEGNKRLEKIVIPRDTLIINNSAFKDCTSLKEVIFEGSENRTIKASCFRGCTSLEKVVLPTNLVTISLNLFEDCTSLKEIELPESLLNIDDDAFRGCTSLEKINLPEGLKYIGNAAFLECSKLSNITLPTDIETILNYAFSKTNIKEIHIPGSVKYIPQYCFYKSSLEKVTIAEGPNKIDSYAFSETNIKEINLPESIETIQNNVFCNCKKLHTVHLGEKIKIIPSFGFMADEKLENINFPSGLLSIQNNAFRDCYNLKVPNFPNELGVIDHNAFANNKVLKEITLPKTIYSLQGDSFDNVDLEHIDVENGGRYLSGGSKDAAIKLALTIPSVVLGCKNSEISEGVLEIAPYAFANVKGLHHIKFPNTLESISFHAFENCADLEELNCPLSLVNIDHHAFNQCKSLKKIKFYEGLIHINQFAFNGVEVDEINIPSTVNTLGLHGMKFNKINIDENNKYYSSLNSNLAYNKRDEMILFTGKNAKLPSYFKVINDGCYEHSNFSKLIIPEGATTLGKAFNNSSYIEELHLPSTLRSISSAFIYNTVIKKIYVDDANPYFTTNEDHTALLDINKKTLILLASGSFIPNGVTKVMPYALSRKGFSKIVIPASLTDLSFMQYLMFDDVKEVGVDKNNPQYASKDNVIYQKLDNALIFGLDATNIPSFIERISVPGFANNASIKNVYINKNIKYINVMAFNGCYNIQKIEVDKDNPVFDSRNNSNMIIATKCNKIVLQCESSVIPNGVGLRKERIQRKTSSLFNPITGGGSIGDFGDIGDDDLPF